MKSIRSCLLPALLLLLAACQTPPQSGVTAKDYVSRADAKRDEGDMDGAMADYTSAIQLNPNDALVYASRGWVKDRKGDNDGAITDYTRAIDLNPGAALPYDSRGLSKMKKGDLDGAISDFNRAILLDPALTYSYRNRGAAKNDKKDYDGAIADFTRAIELNPGDVYSYRSRGAAKRAKGDLDGSVADYSKAIDLEEKKLPSAETLALIKSVRESHPNWVENHKGIKTDLEFLETKANVIEAAKDKHTSLQAEEYQAALARAIKRADDIGGRSTESAENREIAQEVSGELRKL